jgi:hypothetical protein
MAAPTTENAIRQPKLTIKCAASGGITRAPAPKPNIVRYSCQICPKQKLLDSRIRPTITVAGNITLRTPNWSISRPAKGKPKAKIRFPASRPRFGTGLFDFAGGQRAWPDRSARSDLAQRQAIDKLEFRAEQTTVVLLLLVASCSSVANTLICS